MRKFLFFILILIISGYYVYSQTYYMDTNNGQTISTCSGVLYDSGGTGDYSNSENYTITLCSNNGQQIHLEVMNWDIETNWDYLYFYDGPNTSSPSLGVLTGHRSDGTTNDAAIQISSSSGCITLRFTSDGSITDAGFVINISCEVESYSGTPTTQDCLGAIPICGNSYYQPNSYSGTGQYTQEISGVSSCMKEGEKNDVWYVFNAQQSGNLQFRLTPNTTDDYDWSVYNITNYECDDILHHGDVMEVSCNYAITTGATGCLNGYTATHQWAGGTAYNAPIPVTAGETYVINVSNYSSTQYGYTIDFSLASGIMVDTSPPYLQQITSAPACGDNTITFDFSERVQCSSVNHTDFLISGPGGPYTVTNVNCLSGSTFGESFTITLNQNLTAGGSYTLQLVGQVNDACSNPTSSSSLGFTVSGVSASATVNNNVTCYGGSNGSATVTASGGTSPYTYLWSYGSQTTATVNNLPAGTHYVTVTDAGGVCTDVESVVITQPSQLTATINPDPAQVCEGTAISFSGNPSGGTGTYSFHSWTGTGSSYLSTTTAANTNFSSSAPNGTYSLTYTVVDNAGCSGSDNITVTVYDAPVVNAGSGASTCGTTPYTLSGASYGGGASSVTWTSSGTGTFNNTHLINATYTPSAADVSAGSVTLTVTTNDPSGPCTAVTDNMTLTIYNPPTANAGSDASICAGSSYTITGASYGGGASGIFWSTSGTGTFSNNLVINPTYTPSAADIAAGSVTLTLTTNDPAGPCVAASDNMVLTINPLADAGFSYSQGTYCSTGTDPTPTVNTPGGVFSAPAQLVISSVTGAIDLDASTIGGPYTVTYTVGGACPNSSTFNITITSGFDAEFYYDEPFCTDDVDPIPNHNTGSNGTYTASPAGIVFSNPSSGLIDLSASTPGTYTITNTIPASGGCAQATYTDNVSIYQAAVVNAGPNATICQGSNYILSGSSIGGSTLGVTWTTSGTGTFDSNSLLHPQYTPSSADIAAGSVTLTITSNDPAGPCDAATDNMVLTINPVATANAGSDATICEGDSYTLSGTYGGGASDASWSTSGDGTFDNPSNLNAVYTPGTNDIANGSVTLTLTTNDPSGPCNAVSDNMVITINDLPVVDAGSDDVICEGQTYTLSGTMGGGASSVTWTTSGNGTFNNSSALNAIYTPGSADIAAGSVTLTLTSNDPAGPCNAVSDNIVLTINPAATVNAGTNATICEGNTYTLSGATMGGGASSVTWSTSGDGTFDNTSSINPVYTPGNNDISSGSVTLTVLTNDPDNSGPCSAVSDNMVLTINQAPTVDAGADASICAGSDYTLFSSYGGSATSVTWSTSGDGTFDNSSLTNATYTPGSNDISTGSVVLTLTTNDPDNTGPCTAVSDNMTLTINPTPHIDSISVSQVTACVPPFDGNITIYASSGVAPLQYSINNGLNFYTNNVFDSIPYGSYNLIVMSSVGGCNHDLDTAVVVQAATGPNIDSIIVTDVLCYGGNSGEITVYDDEAVAFILNTDTVITSASAIFDTLSAGTYNISVFDAGLCPDYATVTIHQPPALQLSFSDTTEILCAGDSTGSVTITPSGGTTPYTYIWSDPSATTDSTVNNLHGDVTYYVTVSDANNCKNIASITLNDPDSINTSISSLDVSCFGYSDGEAYITASGGTGSLLFNWSVSSNSDTITGLSANTYYYVTTTDDNGCYVVDSVIISEPPALTLSVNSVDATCGGSDGYAVVTVSGGTPNYFYDWVNNSTGNTVSILDSATNLSYGDYTVYVHDNHNCSDSMNVHIDNLGGGVLNVDNVTNVLCNGDGNGEIVVTLTNGTPDFTFVWSVLGVNIDTNITSTYTDTLSGLSGGVYSVTVTDLNGCIADTTITITEPPALSGTVLVSDVDCYGGKTGEINISMSGGVSPYTYTWNPSGFTQIGSIYTGLSAGGYSVTVTDANNCTYSVIEISVSQPSPLDVSYNATDPLCYGGASGRIEATASGGTKPYEYIWTSVNLTSQVDSNILDSVIAGNYYLEVRDSNLCDTVIMVSLNEAPEMLLTITDTVVSYQGSVNVSVTGGVSPYQYLWSNSATTPELTGLVTGVYVLTVTDANQCFVIDSVEIKVPLIIPSLFTPNSDGYNDTWKITNIAEYKDVNIEIYNRWGDLIYSFNGSGSEYISNEWDGTYNGSQLPVGSYVYIITISDLPDPYNGVVSIKR